MVKKYPANRCNTCEKVRYDIKPTIFWVCDDCKRKDGSDEK